MAEPKMEPPFCAECGDWGTPVKTTDGWICSFCGRPLIAALSVPVPLNGEATGAVS